MKIIKRGIAVFVITVVFAATLMLSASMTSHAAGGETWRMSTTSSLNVRASASTAAGIVTRIPAGASYTVTAKTADSSYVWGKVTYGGVSGWCALNYSAYVSGSLGYPYFTNSSTLFNNISTINFSWLTVPSAANYTMEIYKPSGALYKSISTANAYYSIKMPAGLYYSVITASNVLVPAWSSQSSKFWFTVEDKTVPVTSIAVSGSSRLVKGSSVTAKATVSPSSATNKAVVWSSSNSAVAAVSKSGVITGKAYGVAVITCKASANKRVKASYTVKVTCAKPAPPYQVAGSEYNTTSSVRLMWNKVTNADGYIVHKYDSAKRKYVAVRTTRSNYCTVNNLIAGSKNYFRITAFVDTVSGRVYSGASSNSVAVCKPDKVGGFLIKNISSSSVTFKWDAVKGATKYYVYLYNSSAKKFKYIKATTGTTFSYAVSAGKRYEFKVKAVTVYKSITLKSSLSDVFAFRACPASPGVTLSKNGSSVYASWKAVRGAAGYEVYYSTSKNGSYKLLKICNSSTKKAVLSPSKAGKTYYFKVRAFTNAGSITTYGKYSALKSIKA